MQEIDFDHIALSKGEMEVLKELSARNMLFDGEKMGIMAKLVSAGLAEKKAALLNKETCEIVKINDNGNFYLAYKKMEAEEKRKSNLHDWKITIFSTIGGALLSRPLWDSIEWILAVVAKLFQK